MVSQAIMLSSERVAIKRPALSMSINELLVRQGIEDAHESPFGFVFPSQSFQQSLPIFQAVISIVDLPH
jgi:hypothetical protein